MELTIVGTLAALCGSVAAAVVSAWYARKSASSDARKAVDELAETVERFTRVARREQMRRVRSAASSVDESSASSGAPPELVGQVPGVYAVESKADLRRRVMRAQK